MLSFRLPPPAPADGASPGAARSRRRASRVLARCVHLAGLSCLASCAAFPGPDNPEFDSYPPHEGRQVTARVELSNRLVINGRQTPRMDEFAAGAEPLLRQQAVDTFLSSGYFSRASKSVADPDLDVKISILTEGRSNVWNSVASSLTAYIWPNRSTDFRTLEAVVTERSGRSATYVLTDRVVNWQSIFLAPLVPFRPTDEVYKDVSRRMIEHLILKIQEDGALRRATLEGSGQSMPDLDAPVEGLVPAPEPEADEAPPVEEPAAPAASPTDAPAEPAPSEGAAG